MKNFTLNMLLLATLMSCVGTNTDVYYGYSKSGAISSFEAAALKIKTPRNGQRITNREWKGFTEVFK